MSKLQNCLGQKDMHAQLKVNASRNPLKKINKKIDVSVYQFSNKKLIKCF